MTTGELLINGVDIANYGFQPTLGWFCNLIAPAPTKEYIVSKTRLADGSKYLAPNNEVKEDERTFTLPIGYRNANGTRAQMYSALVQLVDIFKQNGGLLTLTTPYIDGVVFRVRYKNITQLQEMNGHMALFSLTLVEPNPADR